MCGKNENHANVVRTCWLVVVCLLLGAGVCAPKLAKAGLAVPLRVADTAPGGLARKAQPVTSGIPLPLSADIKNPDGLELVDAKGAAVPVQFRVMSRWYGTPDDAAKPIKWVLADFQANVPAKGQGKYTLRQRAQDAGSQGKGGGPEIRLSEVPDGLLVDTGVARFVMSRKRFNLFDRVEVGGETVLYQPGAGGLVLADGLGGVFSTLGPPDTFEVEEQGPLKTVVLVRGVFKTAGNVPFAPAVHHPKDHPRFDQPYKESFFQYSCRIHFYAGKSWVRLLLTVENNGANGRTNPEQHFAPVQSVAFDSLELRLGLTGFGAPRAASQEVAGEVRGKDYFELRQWWREKSGDTKSGTLEPTFAKGPAWAVRTDHGLLGAGRLHPGWLTVSGRDRAVSVAMRHFWQNFPKAYHVTQGRLNIGLWPSFGYYPHCRSEDFPKGEFDSYCRDAGKTPGRYYFDAGRHKTHELALSFSAKPEAEETGAERSLALEHPLMALAPPQWYAQSGALGLMAPSAVHMRDKELDEAAARFDKLQLAMVDPKIAHGGTTLNTLRTGSAYWNLSRQNRFFGWMGFGDLLWGNQSPCSLHYDWPYSMLLHYLRTGRRELFDLGVEMARHRSDIDQYHGDRTDTEGNQFFINHMAFYETDAHADPTISEYAPSRVSMKTHTWNAGLVLHYLLTGERTSWASAVENGQAALAHYERNSKHKGCAENETRGETWPMLNLINLYRVNGEKRYLNTARNIAVNRLLYREQALGGRGVFGDGDDCATANPHRQSNTMYVYAIGPILQAHYETRRPELAGMILRMADFVRDHFLFGGTTDGEKRYMPLQSLYDWKGQEPATGKVVAGEIVKNTFYADLFAYAFRLSGDKSYLTMARRCFRDAMFYYAAPGGTYLDPKSRSRIGFLDSMFPSAETKVHGWLGRTNQIYLNTEWLLAAGKLKPKDLAGPLPARKTATGE